MRTWCLSLFILLISLIGSAVKYVAWAQQPSLPITWRTQSDHLLAQQLDQAGPEGASHRMPLVLVHGITPVPAKQYSWELFLKSATLNEQFRQKFHVYLFHYDPTQPVAHNGQLLAKTLKNLIQENQQDCRLRIVAHSMGGMVLLHALQDPEVKPCVDRAIALATPFHGSPLATPGWMKLSFQKDKPLSPMRLSEKPAYWIARSKFPHFEEDFHWDNFDQALPSTIRAGYRQAHSWEIPERLITYGSYFNASSEASQKLLSALEITDRLSAETPPDFKRLDKHGMFVMIHRYIANLPNLEPEKEQKTEAFPSLMQFNDGISPISSSLWLGRFTFCKEKACSLPQQWLALKALRQQHQARLFPALDHRDWLEGTSRTTSRQQTQKVKDLLHPTENAKSVFDWLAADLAAP